MKRKITVSFTKRDLLDFATESHCLSGLDGNDWKILIEKGDLRISFPEGERESAEIVTLISEFDSEE